MPLPPEVIDELNARCAEHQQGVEMGPGVGDTIRIAVFNAVGERVADCVVRNDVLEQDFIDAAERLAGPPPLELVRQKPKRGRHAG